MQATGGQLAQPYGLLQARAAGSRQLSIACRCVCAGFVREDDRRRNMGRIRHAGTARPRTVYTALGNPGQVMFQQTCLTPTSCRRCHFGMLRIEVEANSQLAELAIHMRWVAAGPVLSLRGRCVPIWFLSLVASIDVVTYRTQMCRDFRGETIVHQGFCIDANTTRRVTD